MFFNFNEFSTNKALSKNFTISEVEVEEEYNINFDKSKVIDKGFLKLLKFCNKKIQKKDQNKIKNISFRKLNI